MRVGYIIAVALLVLVFMVGCATQEETPTTPETPPTIPEAPAEEAETPPALPEAPAEAPAEEESELSDAEQAQIERLKTACERGNAGLCAALKNRYNIDWPPAVTEEPETVEEPVEVSGEEI